MKYKYLILPYLFFLPVGAMSLPTQEAADSPAVATKLTSEQQSEQDLEQLKKQKLENIIRQLVNRCEPFPKCL